MASIKHNGLNQSAPRILPSASDFTPPTLLPCSPPIPASNELMLKYAGAQ